MVDQVVALEKAMKRCRRLAEKAAVEKPIDSPSVLAGLMMADLAGAEQEELWVLLCDTRNRLIGKVQVYKGSLNTSMVRIGELFREAIRQNAAGIAVVHNHPSGDPSPSPEDLAVTRAIIEGGDLLDIHVLDHVVIGRGQYVSLRATTQLWA